MRPALRRALPTAVLLTHIALSSLPASGGGTPAPRTASPGAVVGPDVERALAGSGTVPVVILLDVGADPTRPSGRQALRLEVGSAQNRVLDALPLGEFTLRSRPKHAPILAGEIGRAGLERLRRLPGIRRIDLEVPGQGALAQSVPLVGADAVHALGYTGAGMVVGEVDSGVDTDHPDLAGSVVAQACTCRTNGGCCPNGSTFQEGPGAAEDDAGHGTLVAGVMTSDGNVAPAGVAPGAQLVAVKVTDATDRTCCMSDVTAALDWILDNRPDVAAINVSVVSDALYPGDCDNADATTAGMAFILTALRTAGIPVFAAAGNAGSGGSMSAPACVRAAVSMGATYDASFGPVNLGVCSDASTAADQVACFSNSDASTDLFAPGFLITTSALGGGVVSAVGTSFSAPHATACAALIVQADPGTGAVAIETTFKATGLPVVDPSNNLTFPRIDCLAAVQARSCPDADGDDFWAAGPGCAGPPYSDCDDSDPGRSPGAPETCDGIDNDCDGADDEGFDPDGDGLPDCFDNCPADANPGQEDRDADFEGNACDLDDGVIEVLLPSNTQVLWQQEAGFEAYDLYRGDLGALDDTDGDGAAQDYGSCFAENLAGPAFNDTANPAVGHGFLYLVTGRTGGVESGLGTASSGALRPNVHDCASVFGVPPVIQGMQAATASREAVCDVTTPLLGRLCTLGVPSAQAASAIIIHGGYSELVVSGQVTDPDDPPPADLVVTARLLPAAGGSIDVPMFDDGSTQAFPEPQRSPEAGLDCTLDPGSCTCSLAQFGIVSGDGAGADATFTRAIALVAQSLPAIAVDCIMQDRRQVPILSVANQSLDVGMSARDPQGHVTVWPSNTPVVPGDGSYSCGGDPCGCCLLTASDPVTQCSGLPGITSPDFPGGLCLTF